MYKGDNMKPVVLCILDGVGMRNEVHGNAFKAANTPAFDNLWNCYPHSLLEASGELVGLPSGQMGNSEVGHMTIGAGRKLKQDIDRIHEFLDTAIEEDKKYEKLINRLKEENSTIHIIGLFSNGCVHADKNHFLKLYEHLVNDGIKNIYFHLITDGRDTKTNEAYSFIKELEDKINEKKSRKDCNPLWKILCYGSR